MKWFVLAVVRRVCKPPTHSYTTTSSYVDINNKNKEISDVL